MLSARVVALGVLSLGACHHDADVGFDIVRVPQADYAAPDAGGRDGAAEAPDASRGPLVVCIDASDSGDDDCAPSYQGRAYDERVTNRHHNSDESAACCYRRGRFPRGEEPRGGK